MGRIFVILTSALFVFLVRTAMTWRKKLKGNLISGKNHRQSNKSNHCQPHWMDRGRSEVEEGSNWPLKDFEEKLLLCSGKEHVQFRFVEATFFFFLQGIERWRSVWVWRRSENIQTEWLLLRLVIKDKKKNNTNTNTPVTHNSKPSKDEAEYHRPTATPCYIYFSITTVRVTTAKKLGNKSWREA